MEHDPKEEWNQLWHQPHRDITWILHLHPSPTPRKNKQLKRVLGKSLRHLLQSNALPRYAVFVLQWVTSTGQKIMEKVIFYFSIDLTFINKTRASLGKANTSFGAYGLNFWWNAQSTSIKQVTNAHLPLLTPTHHSNSVQKAWSGMPTK